MTIFTSFFHCLPNILHNGHTTAFGWYDCQCPWAYFKVIGLFHIKFIKIGVWYGKSYYRQLIGNHTLALDWCHFLWPWSTFEGHFSLGCHFHVHFSYAWHAFASHGLPAIAELLVDLGPLTPKIYSPKICTKSPISRLVWHIDWTCLRLQGADPCCHGNDIWPRRGDPVAYRLVRVLSRK